VIAAAVAASAPLTIGESIAGFGEGGYRLSAKTSAASAPAKQMPVSTLRAMGAFHSA
jgi:hypothetical protein